MNRCLQPYRRRPPCTFPKNLHISKWEIFPHAQLRFGYLAPPPTPSNTPSILNENARKKDAMFAFTEFSQVDPPPP